MALDAEEKRKDEEEKIEAAQVDWEQLGGIMTKQEILEQQRELERIAAQNKTYEQSETDFPQITKQSKQSAKTAKYAKPELFKKMHQDSEPTYQNSSSSTAQSNSRSELFSQDDFGPSLAEQFGGGGKKNNQGQKKEAPSMMNGIAFTVQESKGGKKRGKGGGGGDKGGKG